MSAITVFRRRESKFLIDDKAYEKIFPVIREHMEPDIYCAEKGSYPVANLYYDTENHDVIRASLEKPFYKEKLRIRSYEVPAKEDVEVYLEIKKKIDGVVSKRRTRMTLREAKRFIKDRKKPAETDYMTEQVLREIGYYLDTNDVYAAFRIIYERQGYFDREDPEFRLTIDRDIRYLKADQVGKDLRFADRRKGKAVLPTYLSLMEVKIRDAYPLWFSHLLGETGVFPVSFSKYGTAYKLETLAKEGVNRENLDILSHI